MCAPHVNRAVDDTTILVLVPRPAPCSQKWHGPGNEAMLIPCFDLYAACVDCVSEYYFDALYKTTGLTCAIRRINAGCSHLLTEVGISVYVSVSPSASLAVTVSRVCGGVASCRLTVTLVAVCRETGRAWHIIILIKMHSICT